MRARPRGPEKISLMDPLFATVLQRPIRDASYISSVTFVVVPDSL